MKVRISTLAGIRNQANDGREIELPCVPEKGSVIEIGDDRLEVVRVFYTFDYKVENARVYISVRDY